MSKHTRDLVWDLFRVLAILGFVVAFLILMHNHRAESAHWQGQTKEWRSDYNGRNNGSCCGEEDCWITSVRIVEEGKETSVVEVDGILIPDFPNSAIHVSQDQNSYACHPYYGAHEPGDAIHDATGKTVAPGIEQCIKHTKNPNCINCIFVTGGA